MNDDKREMVATLFDKVSSLAHSQSKRGLGTEASTALVLGSTIAKGISAMIRDLGVGDVADAIASLQKDRDAGAITDEAISQDNKKVSEYVSSMFEEDVEQE